MWHDPILLLKVTEESKKRSTLEAVVVSDEKKKVQAASSPGSDIVAPGKEWSCYIRQIPWSTKILKREHKILGSMCADARNR